MEIAISILLAVFAALDGWRTKKQLLAAIDSKYVDRMDAAINDLQTNDKQLLNDIQQKLIHKGELALAEKMNSILSDEFKISPEAFIMLKSNLESDQLYKTAMNSNLLPLE